MLCLSVWKMSSLFQQPTSRSPTSLLGQPVLPATQCIAMEKICYLPHSIRFYSAPNWILATHNLFRIRYIFVSHLKNKDIKLPDGIKYWFLDLVLLKIEPVKIMTDWEGRKKQEGSPSNVLLGVWVFLLVFFFQAGLLQVPVTWK